MSIILGINYLHPGSSACILVDGKPVLAIAEERLNRIKYYAGFPVLSIQECLKAVNIKISEVDHIAIPRNSSANYIQKVKYGLKNPDKILNLIKIKNARDSLSDLKTLLSKHFDVEINSLKYKQHNIEHHIAHISSAYFTSKWDKSSGFSLDGSGDFVSSMFAECKGNNIDIKYKEYVPNSLGYFYTMICEFIGFSNYGDEGKVMGLASYGSNSFKDIFDDIIKIKKMGFEINKKYFKTFGSNHGIIISADGRASIENHFSDFTTQKFGKPTNPSKNSEISQRDLDLACSMQIKFEEIYFKLLNQLYNLTPNNKVCMAGGATLNSVANGKIFDNTPFSQTYIQPAAGDDGLSLGAALYVHNAILGNKNRYIMNGSYLGLEFSNEEIEKELLNNNFSYEKLNYKDLNKKVVDDICKNKVVGWFQGKMEWGSRALGNRSILANPSSKVMKDILNKRIKKREWFRPFAPSVLSDYQNEIFDCSHPSPNMMHVYKIKKEWRDKLSAVNHIDNTGRLQTVEKSRNKKYYDLILEFKKRTGIPVLLNTSFNENEPIVCYPKSAIQCFKRTNMDTLVMGNYYCIKK